MAKYIKSPILVENLCKTLCKTLCKSCANFCENLLASNFRRAKLIISTHFSLLFHQIIHRSSSLSLTNLFHFSTISNTTITKI